MAGALDPLKPPKLLFIVALKNLRKFDCIQQRSISSGMGSGHHLVSIHGLLGTHAAATRSM